MDIAVANVAAQISDADMAAAVAAINRQIAEHYAPEWGQTASVSSFRLDLGGAQANLDGRADAVIYVGDKAQDPTTGVDGVWGYHSNNYSHVPYGFVYIDVCEQMVPTIGSMSWTAVLSHEVLELLADPTLAFLITGPAPNDPNSTVNYALEVCDPTQGDTYKIDNVDVSNFVTKKYFNLIGGVSAGTNFLNLTLAPFGVRPRGNNLYSANNGAFEIWGKEVTAGMRRARTLLGKGRRNVRRRERIGKDGTS